MVVLVSGSVGSMSRPISTLRHVCLSFPDAVEKVSHAEPTWFCGEKGKVFCMSSDHHHDDRVGFWCPQPPGAQEALVASDPERFFVPPYVGGKGWVGVRLDVPSVDWDEAAELVEDAYRHVAPKGLVAKLDARMSKADAYDRLASVCEALPEVEMKPFGGHYTPAWRVRDKIFCGTGQVGRASMTVKGAPGAQEALVRSDPERFYVPAYSGSKGWIGAYLDVPQDWDEISELVVESYRLVAPRKLAATLG